eukprot:CAMPEP_0170567648 /NCGR_PEP_ID=MMETSP0211-20121228/80613_1 /TAXON_ID=311385 /ORGANISM="Pseudokeronopsis sp., Strain OXSARD2" /LENGTH=103 /DNA_ID=CAMNT_0010889163 /DNA_START=1733 /DNA_END=2044 /DNA_ORIENTATION=+
MKPFIKGQTKVRVQKDVEEYKTMQTFGITGNGLRTGNGLMDDYDREELLQLQQDKIRDKKVKDHMRKREKEQKLIKAKQMQLQGNAPLSKYYREQGNSNVPMP